MYTIMYNVMSDAIQFRFSALVTAEAEEMPAIICVLEPIPNEPKTWIQSNIKNGLLTEIQTDKCDEWNSHNPFGNRQRRFHFHQILLADFRRKLNVLHISSRSNFILRMHSCFSYLLITPVSMFDSICRVVVSFADMADRCTTAVICK